MNPRLAAQIAIPFSRLREDDPDDRYQGLRIPSCLNACSGLYVGRALRGRRFAKTLCGRARTGAPWRRRAAYGKENAVYRRQAAGCNRARPRTPARNPIRYPAHNAAARGIGWHTRGRRVAARYDEYAQRYLGFPYLKADWIWLNSNFNTVWGTDS